MNSKRHLLFGLLGFLLALAILPSWAQGQQGKSYAPDQIRNISTEDFIVYMLKPQPGYWQFAAMNALAEKAKNSNAAARRSILSLVTAVMKDTGLAINLRFQCCYVLSGSGDEQVVPDLIEVLLHDASETMRGVAAEALADLYRDTKNKPAYDALRQAARQDSSPMVRETLTRRLGQILPAAVPNASPEIAPGIASGVKELAPQGPPKFPAGPARPVNKPLPWPFPGNQADQIIFNNYQQATDGYIHCALDFMHPAGTPVIAVDSGYVAAIFTNYPTWKTHHSFVITPKKGGSEGWCYTHLDPDTFEFKQGDFVRQGQTLGTLVDFSVGDKPGNSHLHLQYVKFTKYAANQTYVHSLLDPLYFFNWQDTQPPVFQPLHFVPEGVNEEFCPNADGIIAVNGKVDVLAAVADSAFPGHLGNLGVPIIMLSISDGAHTMQKLVLDHRGDVGNETQVKPLYLSYDEKKVFFNPDGFPRYQMLRVTKTDGDGKITTLDALQCWDTTARDRSGKPAWPDGRYSVNVYAWDIAGNRAAAGTVVTVRNN